jgi:phenylalanine-4-hydroxylase
MAAVRASGGASETGIEGLTAQRFPVAAFFRTPDGQDTVRKALS